MENLLRKEQPKEKRGSKKWQNFGFNILTKLQGKCVRVEKERTKDVTRRGQGERQHPKFCFSVLKKKRFLALSIMPQT